VSAPTEADIVNNAVAADPVPTMPGSLDTSVQLLRGLGQKLDDGDDTWHDVAYVKELTGADEEYLATLETKKGLTYTEYMTALLERSVERVGTLVVKDMPGLLNKLILADRDMLFLGIVRATYGTTRDLQVICPKCQTQNDVTLDLDADFPVTQPGFDLREPIDVQTKKGVIHLRMPNGEDTIKAQQKSTSDAELNTIILSRCAMWDEGTAPADPVDWAKGLNIADRRKLVNTLINIEIGPKLEGVETQCATCGEDMPILLDWVSLLLS
jgi:hypothetical protein